MNVLQLISVSDYHQKIIIKERCKRDLILMYNGLVGEVPANLIHKYIEKLQIIRRKIVLIVH